MAKKDEKRAKYEAAKARVIGEEVKNFSQLILIPSGDEWYKMGGNSLLIYNYKIAPLLKIKPNIQPDTDYTKKIFEDGLVSFRGLENIESKLRRLEILKEIKSMDGAIYFCLNYVVDKAQMESYRQTLKTDRDRLLKVVIPTITTAPLLYEKMRHVQKRIYEIVRKMNVYERDYNGSLMTKYSRMMVKYYMMMSEEMLDATEGWKKILELAKMLAMELAICSELKILSVDVCARIGEEVMEIKQSAEKEVTKRK